MGDYLSKDQILAAEDITTDEVAVPEWGGTLRIKALSGTERDRLEAQITDAKSGKVTLDNTVAKIVAASVVDDDGQRMFAPNEVKALGEKSARALYRVAEAAKNLSAMSDQDVEELAGNSEPGQ